MITSCIETITPETAQSYFQKNIKNRPIKMGAVDALARDIKNGSFVITHQGIAFDTNGNLVDGQHRLLAIISAGIPVQMMVTRGLEPDTKLVVDRGEARTMRDVMTISDFNDEDTALLLRSQQILSAINQIVECNYKKIKTTYNEQIKLFELLRPHIAEAYKLAVSKKVGHRSSQIVSATIAELYHGVSPDALSKFFTVFNKADIHNCNGYNVTAALSWRRQLDDVKLKGLSMARNKIYLGTQAAIWHFVNNTDVRRIIIPGSPKYDMKELVKSIVD